LLFPQEIIEQKRERKMAIKMGENKKAWINAKL
jgi:hypothetical protein